VLLALAATVASLAQPALPLKRCVAQYVPARCGTLQVPENRARPEGRKIGLKIVVIPAQRKPVARDAFTFLAGGPGGAAATEMPSNALAMWPYVHEHHDILLVDQRGTGGSNPLTCAPPKREPKTPAEMRSFVDRCLESLAGDPRYYGSRAAADDLEAVRLALGYRALNVYGTSYGATLAQVYLSRHPSSVRTMMLDGGTFVDVPFYSKFAANAQRALDLVDKRCSADLGCRDRFPKWRRQLDVLVEAWNGKPIRVAKVGTIDGDGLASVIQSMLRSSTTAASIPLLVNRAAARDYSVLAEHVDTGNAVNPVMYWTIWCNEPWVGLNAKGPWQTIFDGFTTSSIVEHRRACAYMPKHPEPAAQWKRPQSSVPLLAIAGEADPQDPIGNLPGLRRSFPNSRVLVARGQGHAVGQNGCIGLLVANVVDRGSVKGLDTSCLRFITPTPFQLRK
jgi:pimeloyl-ACP methyl ester carboxylesterase